MRLGDVASKIGSGATPRGGRDVYLASGPIALVRSQNVLMNSFSRDGLAFIDAERASGLDGVAVCAGDVLLNITGDSVARVCQSPTDLGEARVNQHVAIIRTRADQLDSGFLRYFLVWPRTQARLLALASAGATRPALTKGMIENLSVPDVEIAIQRRISAMLGALDSKIEANRRVNETLEGIARALFKSWFVDFDPVCAKAEGRSAGLSQEVTALFPPALTTGPLGPQPEGWRLSKIGEEVSVIGGTTPSTASPEFWGGDHAWATPKDLSGLNEPVLLETERSLTAAGLAKVGSGLLPVDTVLLSSRAPIGYLAIAKVPTAINQGFVAMVCDRVIGPCFAYLWAGQNLDVIKSRSNGSTFQEISKGSFKGISLIAPPAPVADCFEQIVRPMFDRIALNAHQSRTLAALRDLLLPKLMSGEVRVKDAEAMLEEVA